MRSIFVASVVTASLLAGAAVAGVVTHRAHGPINQIIDFSDTDGTTTTSTSFVDLPSSSFNLIIPSGKDQIVMARFTAEAGVNGTALEKGCSARIMAGSAEMTPNSSLDYADNTNEVANQYNWVGAGLDRSMVLHPGTYVIKVQYASDSVGNTCELDDWHLNVMTADNGT